MPSIYQLKPAFQQLLRPLVKSLYQWGITANMVTISAMLLSIAVSLWIYWYYQQRPAGVFLLLFPLWMLIRMAFNAIDGMLAREFNQQSDLGAFYNELCDVISDTALYLCLIVFSLIHSYLLLLMVFLAILSEYAGVMAPMLGQQRRYDGPMGKSDRAFWLSILCILLVLGHYLNIEPLYLNYLSNSLLLIIILLLLVTIYNRIRTSLNS